MRGLLRYARLRDAVLSGRPPRLMYARYEIAPLFRCGLPPAIESDRRGNVRKRLCFFLPWRLRLLLQITPFHYRWIAHYDRYARRMCCMCRCSPLAPRERCEPRAGQSAVLLQAHPPDLMGELISRFAGDSAGGSLCLSLAMLARDRALPLPARLVLLSPCCSL